MKGLPRAIVLGLLASVVGEGREYPVPSGSRDGHQPTGIGTASLWRVCVQRGSSPKRQGAQASDIGEWGIQAPGSAPHLPGSAQTARLWCRVWFQDKLLMPPRAPC